MNNQIKERPILFNSATVIAILEGRKTQTRRAINPQPELTSRSGFSWKGESFGQNSDFEGTCRNFSKSACKFGKPGDRLWVRETFQGPLFYDEIPEDWNSDKYKTPAYCHYKASGDSCDFTDADDNFVESWQPSIHMPRWASRILLEITNVRVERLNEISEEDAIAEGVQITDEYTGCADDIDDYRHAYKFLWESINGQGSWNLNQWVWVIEFKVIKK